MRLSIRRAAPAAALALTVLFITGVMPASAQYFGRQKVQYEDFAWRVLDTNHFNIHFYPQEQAATEDAAREAERWYSRFGIMSVAAAMRLVRL